MPGESNTITRKGGMAMVGKKKGESNGGCHHLEKHQENHYFPKTEGETWKGPGEERRESLGKELWRRTGVLGSESIQRSTSGESSRSNAVTERKEKYRFERKGRGKHGRRPKSGGKKAKGGSGSKRAEEG